MEKEHITNRQQKVFQDVIKKQDHVLSTFNVHKLVFRIWRSIKIQINYLHST